MMDYGNFRYFTIKGKQLFFHNQTCLRTSLNTDKFTISILLYQGEPSTVWVKYNQTLSSQEIINPITIKKYHNLARQSMEMYL